MTEYTWKNDAVTVDNLKRIDERLVPKVVAILDGLEALGHEPRIFEGLRTVAQQREKVKKGYSKTMKSYHLTGLAVDIADRRYGWSGPAAKLSFKFWKDLGILAHKDPELVWGGVWCRPIEAFDQVIRGQLSYFVDVAHVQYGRSTYCKGK